MKKNIITYYSDLAQDYDTDRFNNTYGKFIDQQEKKILKKLLKDIDKNFMLDLGCGTGRFLEFVNNGVDINSEMIKVAKQKYPIKNIFVEDASDTHFNNETFNIVISFHLIMHLNKEKTIQIINEAYRILKKGGRLIFDIPSTKRRSLINYKAKDWHGANDFSKKDILNMISKQWKLINYYGILFLPIHRFPKRIRHFFIRLDNLLCRSFLKEYSSYLVFNIQKL